MKKILFTVMVSLLSFYVFAQSEHAWSNAEMQRLGQHAFDNRYRPDQFKIFTADMNLLRQVAARAGHSSAFLLEVPASDGSIRHYEVHEVSVMDDQLQARYPEIRTYSGKGIEDPTATIQCDMSPRGFHAMILSNRERTMYIDPIQDAQFYVVFSRPDNPDYRSNFHCLTTDVNVQKNPNTDIPNLAAADDGKLRTYRLALACTGEYAQYFLNGTETTDAQRKSKVLSAMATLLSRTNGIYERDFGIHMNLIANNDAIIYLNPSTDPWTTEWNTKTQQTIDAVIGSANYDIGHLVHKESTAANNNGNAGCIACVCKAGSKGSGFTSHVTPEGDPFVVDYTTHEMGHQFGANHTFTFSNESGTASQMEPGSGTTIMGYAGITGATTDVQPHSDDYFHARSIEQITTYIKSSTGGGACAVVTVTGNATPTANAGAAYTIPKSTPFALTGTGTDADAGDVLNYTWEQTNTGTSTTTIPSATATSGPVFRSRYGGVNPTRTFPILASILDGTNGNKWEVLPSVARTLNFRFTVRDNHPGGGNSNTSNTTVTISSASGPFSVTSPNTAVTWASASTQTVTWNVASSNLTPVSCANVKISLSTDGGQTFPTVLLASTPNDGSEVVTLPAVTSTTARIKIEAVGNIFFDISNTNFTIGAAASCANTSSVTASSITTTSATIGWAAVSGAVSYAVDYKANSSSTWISAATATTSTSLSLSGLTAGTLYDVRVRTNCSSSNSVYTSAQFTTTSASGGCTTAYESNETQATAAAIATNTAISAAIGSSTDVDYYSFTTTSASNLAITLSNLAGDYDLYLYNSAGTQLGSSTAGSTTNESISLASQAAGTYYIKVIGYSGAFSTTVCYSLNAGSTVATGCQSSYDNTTNGTTSGAASIPFNTNITGLINPSGDIDNYKFVITTGGTITVSLSTLPADFDLKLLNSAGTQVGISQNGSTTAESVSYTAAAGTYYAQVYGYNGALSASTCYTLKVQLGTASKPVIDVPVAKQAYVKLYPNPVTDKVTVSLPALPTGKATISIVDSKGTVVSTRQQTAVIQSFDISTLPAGLYLVKVSNGNTITTEKFIKQ